MIPEAAAQRAYIQEHGALPPGVKEVPAWTLGQMDAFIQDNCVHLHQQGLPVDLACVEALCSLFRLEAAYWRQVAADAFGVPDFNPNSSQQLAKILYTSQGWGLDPLEETDTGAPSVSDTVILEHCKDPRLSPQQFDALRAVGRYRTVASKWFGTYAWPLHPGNYGQTWDKKGREKIENKKGCIVWPEQVARPGKGDLPPDRIRSSWNAHGTPVGRYSCSQPMNLQTIPSGCALWSFRGQPLTDWMRATLRACRAEWKEKDGRFDPKAPIKVNLKHMFAAPPGLVFCGADADQIHLRIVASMWGVKRLLNCFDQGGCPHALATALMFEDTFLKNPDFPQLVRPGEPYILAPGAKWKGQAKNYRQTGKTGQYTFLYGGTAYTAAGLLKGSEDEYGELPHLRVNVKWVEAIREKWMAGMPEIPGGWANEELMATANAAKAAAQARKKLVDVPPFLTGPVCGRLQQFHNGVEEGDLDWNRLTNFRTLASEAAIMHLAEERLLRAIPWEAWGPGTGPVIQVHDSLSVLAPENLRGATPDIYDMATGGVVTKGKSARDNTGKYVADQVAEAITSRLLTLPGVVFSASGTYGDTLADA